MPPRRSRWAPLEDTTSSTAMLSSPTRSTSISNSSVGAGYSNYSVPASSSAAPKRMSMLSTFAHRGEGAGSRGSQEDLSDVSDDDAGRDSPLSSHGASRTGSQTDLLRQSLVHASVLAAAATVPPRSPGKAHGRLGLRCALSPALHPGRFLGADPSRRSLTDLKPSYPPRRSPVAHLPPAPATGRPALAPLALRTATSAEPDPGPGGAGSAPLSASSTESPAFLLESPSAVEPGTCVSVCAARGGGGVWAVRGDGVRRRA
jgi:hypothetical protein